MLSEFSAVAAKETDDQITTAGKSKVTVNSFHSLEYMVVTHLCVSLLSCALAGEKLITYYQLGFES